MKAEINGNFAHRQFACLIWNISRCVNIPVTFRTSPTGGKPNPAQLPAVKSTPEVTAIFVRQCRATEPQYTSIFFQLQHLLKQQVSGTFKSSFLSVCRPPPGEHVRIFSPVTGPWRGRHGNKPKSCFAKRNQTYGGEAKPDDIQYVYSGVCALTPL